MRKLKKMVEGLGAREFRERPFFPDPYEVLGVATDATSAEIRKAFRALSLKWHPDKNTGADQEEATAKFASIGAAYEKIGTPDARAMYDDFGEDPGGFDTYVRRHSVSPVRWLLACMPPQSDEVNGLGLSVSD